MDSPLARVILAIFSGYLIILLFLSIWDWIDEEYPRRPTKPSNIKPIQHPLYHEEAVIALQKFSKLPAPEKKAVKKSLVHCLISMEEWLAGLDSSKYQIMCIGELHEESTRDFLAEKFFASFNADVLLLEATPKTMKRLVKRLDSGRDYFPLLDADIMNILRAVKERNPGVQIHGIEETDEQQKVHRHHTNSRDQSIAINFWEKFQPGKRHIILFGALHCTNESNWLYNSLCHQAPSPLKERMINVQILEEHQNGPVEAFVYFLDKIGINKKQFVLHDSGALHPYIHELFHMLKLTAFEKYSTLIVFRI